MKNGLLTIPDNGEIEAVRGQGIRERAVLHEWPLSRVERITWTDGSTAIVKTQLTMASAERAFYRSRKDPALLSPLADGVCGDCDWMLLEDLGSAHEDWSGFTDEAIRERVRVLRPLIRRLDGAEVPVFFDFQTPEKLVEACLGILPTLREAGIPKEELDALLDWAEHDARVLWDSPAVLLHGDLKGENVVPRGSGWVLLDWQRPMRGPESLDEELALLLADRKSRGMGAALARFVMGYWYAWAYRTCLPVPFVLGMAGKMIREIPGTL
ncbi:MAG: phosphotransferase [Clostridia bacterium]|nr:phosphotransferase [Clostridia bacterium]